MIKKKAYQLLEKSWMKKNAKKSKSGVFRPCSVASSQLDKNLRKS